MTTTDLPESFKEELASQKISEIIEALSESPNWPPAGDVEIRFIPTHGLLGEKSPAGDLELLSENVASSLSESLLELREVMSEPEHGAWLEFRMNISGVTNEFSIAFDFDKLPEDFEGNAVSVDLLIDDLDRYPRDLENIPDWLKAALVGVPVS